MPVILRGGPEQLNGTTVIVSIHDTLYRTRVGMGEKAIYEDSGDTDPLTGYRIFAYRPPKPVEDAAAGDQELGDDDE